MANVVSRLYCALLLYMCIPEICEKCDNRYYLLGCRTTDETYTNNKRLHEALLFSLIQNSQFRIRQILSDCGQFSEISGGVVLSGMDTAPSDYRKYFPTLQYLHCILSPDSYGHFAHVISVQRLMFGIYIMWLVVVIEGGSSAAGFVETLLCIVNWKGWNGLCLFQVLVLELLWKETYWRKLRYDISDDNHDTSQRRCRSDCARYKPLRGPGLDEILVPFFIIPGVNLVF